MEIIDLSQYFGTLPAFVAVVLVLVQFVKGITGLKDFAVQAISWLVGSIVALAAWYFDLGIFAEVTWYQAVITGVIATLSANGFFKIPVAKTILEYIDILLAKLGWLKV